MWLDRATSRLLLPILSACSPGAREMPCLPRAAMKGAVCREQAVPCTLDASTVLWPLGFTLMMTSGIMRVSLFLKGDVDFDGTVRAVDFVAEQTLAVGGEPGL